MPRSPVTFVVALVALLLAPALAHAAAPANTAAPSISGSARAGQTLSRDVGTWSGSGTITYTQRWLKCDATGVECVAQSATGATYTLIDSDVGSTYRVDVTATNPDGVATVRSEATAEVTGTPPSVTTAPSVSGNLRQNQTLTAGKGTWTGTQPIFHAYEWRRCDADGSYCAAIAGATAPTYALTATDVGSTVRVRVTAHNAAGDTDATSAATAVVGPPAPPVSTAPPTIGGTARDASTLSSTTGAWSGATTITYTRRWQRCSSLGIACLDTTATTPTYAVGAADIGSTIRLVVTATNPDGTATATSDPTAIVAPNPPSSTALPAMSGATRVGQTLTVTNGTWVGTAPLTYARQWRRCDSAGTGCTAIAGETGATHVLTADDLDHTLRVAITATNDGGTATAVANPTTVVGPPQPPVNDGSVAALPSIAGSMVDGQTLTSATGTWTGAATITTVRRWQRCDAAGAACVSTGATSATYKLTSADVGSTLRLQVTATNADGTATAASAVTAVVAPLPPARTAAPAISGTAKDLQVLSATTGAWNGTTPISHAYQWLRCDAAGAGCTEIAGATASTFTLSGTDIGQTVKVQVTATNSGGSASATSGATAIVAAAAPVNTVAPVVSGTPRDGLTLTASTGTWTGTAPITYTYQWQRCSAAGSGCTNVTGATAATYELTPADVNSTLKVTVTAANGAGTPSQTSPLTLKVQPAPPVSTAAPVVAGTPVDGSVLSVSQGSWTGTPTLSLTYRWERCDALLPCRAIAGATAATYTLTSADVNASVRAVVTALNAGGTASAPTAATPLIGPLAPSVTAAPAISGTASDGQTISVSSGTWAGTTPVTFEYRWLRCDADGANCADVAGATGTAYALTADDVGATVRAAVTASNAGGDRTHVTGFSAVIAPKAPVNAVTPTINGVARDGNRLSADPGDWIGTPDMELAYQWQRCNPTGAQCAAIDGAVLRTYVLTTADVGATLRAVVSATNGGGTASATTAASGVVQTNPPVNLTPPAITGNVVDGELLTAVDGTWTGVVTIGYDHRWWRCDTAGRNCGIVAGENASTYRVGGTDVGLTIKVEVIARNAGGSTSAFSDASPVGRPAAPVSTGAPVVTGHHGVTQLLEASRGSWVGSPTLAYAFQWQRCATDGSGCSDLAGEDSDAYRLTEDDLGSTIRVAVTVSNAAGSATALSQATPVVRDDPPVVVTLPAIRGDLVADTVELQADDGTWTGAAPMAPAYQWRRCDVTGGACTDIAGATSARYTPATADVGSTLRVLVTMDNGVGETSARSAASGVVAPAPPRSTAAPVITAAGFKPGAAFSGDTGTWAGAAPIALTRQWLRCALDGGDCVPIDDANAAKYTLTGADIGHALRLRITATNATASSSATSAPAGPVTAVAPSTAGKPKATAEGKPRVGSVLRADAGTWKGSDPLVYSYQWQRCSSTTDCRDIGGATGGEYTATVEDVGRRLRAVVRASNVAGTASAESALSDAVIGLSPVVGAKPQVSGTLRDGRTLTASAGGWSGTAPFAYAYAWERCTSAGCKPIKGAETVTYRLTSEDVGQRIAVKVTASNAYGKAEAESTPSSPVAGVRPASRKRPTVSRLPTVLEPKLKLRGRPGAFTGSTPMDLAYQWLACDAYGTRCRMVKGATTATYELRRRDLKGTRLRRPLRLAVTASNAAGERTALSAPVGARRRKPKARVTLPGSLLMGRRLAIAVECAAGSAPCTGRIVVGRRSVAADVAAGSQRPVAVALSRKEAKALRTSVRVTFRSAGRASGRSVAARVDVTRITVGASG